MYSYIVCIYNRISLSPKKEWNNVIFSNMYGPRDYHTEWSKSDKDKNRMISLFVESKKNYTNEFIHKIAIDLDKGNKLILPKGKVGQG